MDQIKVILAIFDSWKNNPRKSSENCATQDKSRLFTWKVIFLENLAQDQSRKFSKRQSDIDL